MRISSECLFRLTAAVVAGVTVSAGAASITWTNGTFSDTGVLPAAADVEYGVNAGGEYTGPVTGITLYQHFEYNDYNDGAVMGWETWRARSPGLARSTGDAAFDTVLGTYIMDENGGRAKSLQLKALTIGQQYEVLLLNAWTSSLPFGSELYMQAADGRDGANELQGSLSASQRFSYQNVGDPIGGYVAGTFVADAVTQTFYILTTGFDAGMTAAVFVSRVPAPIPEPASLAVLALGGLAVLRRRA